MGSCEGNYAFICGSCLGFLKVPALAERRNENVGFRTFWLVLRDVSCQDSTKKDVPSTLNQIHLLSLLLEGRT